MTIQAATEKLIRSLALTRHGEVLAAAAVRLAADIDELPVGAPGASALVNSLRATMAEVIEKGCEVDAEESDWQDIAAKAGATPIRDAAQS